MCREFFICIYILVVEHRRKPHYYWTLGRSLLMYVRYVKVSGNSHAPVIPGPDRLLFFFTIIIELLRLQLSGSLSSSSNSNRPHN